jgi:hypothetical protein
MTDAAEGMEIDTAVFGLVKPLVVLFLLIVVGNILEERSEFQVALEPFALDAETVKRTGAGAETEHECTRAFPFPENRTCELVRAVRRYQRNELRQSREPSNYEKVDSIKYCTGVGVS